MIELAKLRGCDLLTSPHALAEARRNLVLKRPEAVPRLEKAISGVEMVSEADSDAVGEGLDHGLPLKDAPILGAAIQADANLLGTGDGKHFGHLYEKPIDGMRVVPPAVALAQLLKLEE